MAPTHSWARGLNPIFFFLHTFQPLINKSEARGTQDARTPQSKQADRPVTEKASLELQLVNGAPLQERFQKLLPPTYFQRNVSQANQLKCVIIKGILACD